VARAVRIVFLLSLGGGACNALSGAADLEIDPCAGGRCAQPDASPDGADILPDGGTIDASDGASADADDASVRPSFCEGLSLYLPFEGTTTAAQGDVPVRVNGTPAYTSGKLGQGYALNGSSSIFYTAVPDAGTVRYATDVGTVAMWFRPTWSYPGGAERTFARPKDTLGGSGPGGPQLFIGAGPPVMGMEVPNLAFAGGTLASFGPFWANLDWNHLVGTWSTTSTPTLTFALNGGSMDAGATYRETAEAWSPPDPVVYFRVGSTTNPVDGVVDEVALWTRVLPLSEIRTVYDLAANGQSIGAACRL
jgi:hypothetical protein